MTTKKFIYTLTNPLDNKIFYVGYTNSLRSRLNAHMKCKCNPLKSNIIKEIINNGLKPIMSIIDESDYVFNKKENMYEHERLEKYYIKKYKDEGIVLPI
jgi:hypothetical protein